MIKQLKNVPAQYIKPIVVELFDSPILVEGEQKNPPT